MSCPNTGMGAPRRCRAGNSAASVNAVSSSAPLAGTPCCRNLPVSAEALATDARVCCVRVADAASVSSKTEGQSRRGCFGWCRLCGCVCGVVLATAGSRVLVLVSLLVGWLFWYVVDPRHRTSGTSGVSVDSVVCSPAVMRACRCFVQCRFRIKRKAMLVRVGRSA